MVEDAKRGGVDEEEVVTVDTDDDDGDFEVIQPNEQWQTLQPGKSPSVP